MDEKGGYEKYRQMRTFYLQTYAQALLIKHPQAQRIIGIAMEPPGQGRGASEDIIYAAQAEWTEGDRKLNREDCSALGIMGEMKQTQYHGAEFPMIDRPIRKILPGNRKQRRAQAARGRRRD